MVTVGCCALAGVLLTGASTISMAMPGWLSMSVVFADNSKAAMANTCSATTHTTTMAFVRILSTLVRDKQIGKYIVPIVPDEARTFGMEGMFRQLGIYSSAGQLYEPQDNDQVMFYKESKDGQILEEYISDMDVNECLQDFKNITEKERERLGRNADIQKGNQLILNSIIGSPWSR